MTSRINRNKPEYHGSTIKAIEQPDFLVSGDPWFRPVDIHVGPDGAVYILDFYNRIIGHYEVPLTHPGRDRTSGRIWRVVYKGDRGTERGSFLREEVTKLWSSGTDEELLAGAKHESPVVRTHAMKALGERAELTASMRRALVAALADSDAFVMRAAAETLGRHPEPSQLRPLLGRLRNAPAEDVLLAHALRIAVRDHIAAIDSLELEDIQLSDAELRDVASVCVAVRSPTAAVLLLRYLKAHSDHVTEYLEHAAKHAEGRAIQEVMRMAKAKAGADVQSQAQIVLSLAKGLANRGAGETARVNQWASDVASRLLDTSDDNRIGWTAVAIENLPPSENPWVIAPRPSRDGDKDSLFFHSLPKGEQRTGVYRSRLFAIPEKLSFWCAGHSGLPRQRAARTNFVRLLDAATHTLLAESQPPRNDTAREFTWNLPGHAGKQGYIELVDGDGGNAYAWLAVGRFSLDALNPSEAPRRQQFAAEIVGQLKLAAFQPRLASLLVDPQTEVAARTAIAQALVALDPDARGAALAAALADPSLPEASRPRMGYAITVKNDSEYLDNLREVFRRAPTRLQTTLADTLAGDLAGAGALLTLIEAGQAAPRLLLAPNIANKLKALNDAAIDHRVEAIRARLPAPDAILDALITDRRRAFAGAATNRERGEAVFTKHCANCHQIAGRGATIGPQLDGIGDRGLDRLMEDLLDPNRNVDMAFRTTTLRLADGRVVTGLVRREEGAQVVLADAQGKEFSVIKGDIEEQQKTPLSLMPANVGEIVTPEEFADLMGYLLGQRAARP
jgi:putative heme-binding domain-containing protein